MKLKSIAELYAGADRCLGALLNVRKSLMTLVVLTSLGSYLAAASASVAEAAFLGVRVLKTAGAGELTWSAHLPASCVGCELIVNRLTSGQNSKEILFHISMPKGMAATGPIVLQISPAKVRAVLASYTDVDLPKRGFVRAEARASGVTTIAFTRGETGITFDVPAALHGHDLPPDDLADVSEQYSYLESAGLYVRIGHADSGRRSGPYTGGAWPAVEARAALNLEFATREAVKKLHLVNAVQAAGAATIMLMNFDTNYPTLGPDEAHEDWPPHWHMHLYWNTGPKVRRVGHFFIAPNGLLTQDQVSELKPGSSATFEKRWYARGEADETRAPDGRLLYAQTITPEGYFMLSSPTSTCRFRPLVGGFDSGVHLSCSGQREVRLRAEDDISSGTLRVFLDDKMVEQHRYDTDTGELLDDGRIAGSRLQLEANRPHPSAPTYFRLNK